MMELRVSGFVTSSTDEYALRRQSSFSTSGGTSRTKTRACPGQPVFAISGVSRPPASRRIEPLRRIDRRRPRCVYVSHQLLMKRVLIADLMEIDQNPRWPEVAYQVYVTRAQIVFAVYGLNAYCSEMNDGCDTVFSVSGLKAKSSTSYFSNQ